MQDYFIAVAACVGLAMLIWDCVEVGRNDAANLVNALLGARVLRRRIAVNDVVARAVSRTTAVNPSIMNGLSVKSSRMSLRRISRSSTYQVEKCRKA